MNAGIRQQLVAPAKGETRQESTDLTHVFWHTKSMPENVGGELLRQAGSMAL
jgi:hypothetical protein